MLDVILNVLTKIGNFILSHPAIFIFYAVIIALLIIFRKKIDRQAKIIFLYRMKWGLKWMDKVASKRREWIILLGYIGMGAGFVGLVVISYVLIKNLIDLITTPAASSGVSLVLPGLNIPGVGVLDFSYWLIVIFVVAVTHEFAHGVVARAHKIEVKNTGLVLFGPIIGAFVEPNEKKLRRQKDFKQYSVLAAGAFTNVVLALVALVLFKLAFIPLQETMIEPTGFAFDSYYGENMPVEKAGIPTGKLINSINGKEIKNFETFSEDLFCMKPGDKLTLTSENKDYNIELADSPDKPGKAFLGISSIRNEFDIKEKYQSGVWKYLYYALDWWNGFLKWFFILSLGIGLFNLLPLPIVDGGRMTQIFLRKLKGEERGDKAYKRISIFFLFVLLLNLVFPFLAGLF
jgi:membrane-associated protease RseP (regulator of RpoE activity)